MSRGIFIVAFGSEYQKISDACLKITRKNTSLPIHVETEITTGLPINLNRLTKLQMFDRSPFDETLYLDCDSLVQRPGIEAVFDMLSDYDVVLNPYYYWKKGNKILRIYKRAMNQFGCKLPITIWNGAFVCFKKTDSTRKMLDLWRKYWMEFGKGREMPCLACAVQKSGVSVGELPYRLFASDGLSDQAFVQHHCKGFVEKFGLPSWERWTPFDTDPKDFNWVDE